MSTTRAKRLERALSRQGWETGGDSKACKCGRVEYGSEAKYCCACGKKLPTTTRRTSVYAELEEAIAYALGEQA